MGTDTAAHPSPDPEVATAVSRPPGSGKGQEARCSETFIALSLTVSMDKTSLRSLFRCPLHVRDTIFIAVLIKREMQKRCSRPFF